MNGLRKKLLETLRQTMESGESLSMRNLANQLSVAANTILYHLRKLESDGFIVRDAKGKVVRVNSPDEKSALAYLPLLGSARCGLPLEEIADESTIRMVPIPLRLLGRNTKKNLYLVKAVGDSMTPKIDEGDFVIFEANVSPSIGNVVVARTHEGFTIKIFKETEDEYILRSFNTSYEPFVFDKHDINKTFNIDGVAVGSFKPPANLKDSPDESVD